MRGLFIPVDGLLQVYVEGEHKGGDKIALNKHHTHLQVFFSCSTPTARSHQVEVDT